MLLLLTTREGTKGKSLALKASTVRVLVSGISAWPWPKIRKPKGGHAERGGGAITAFSPEPASLARERPARQVNTQTQTCSAPHIHLNCTCADHHVHSTG
jgi:hypothetical protein